MKRWVFALLTIVAAGAAGACDLTSRTSPTPMASQVLGGTWTTLESQPGNSGSLQDSCVNFRWTVTQFTGTSGSGTFSATCLGDVDVVGSASGTLSGSVVNWSANATGTRPGLPPCAIALTGTATPIENNRIRIPYSGTTCLGPVSGTEVVGR